ncbi:hypothetical protein A3721_08890 [Sulfitobacter sp. HI0023]|nr:hypothetical protein A3721_08890 [Sulfitobacter sp. HI0023]
MPPVGTFPLIVLFGSHNKVSGDAHGNPHAVGLPPLIVELFVMGGIIYLVGLVVVVLAILSLLGLA